MTPARTTIHSILGAVLLTAMTLLSGACARQPAPEPVTIPQVLQMSEAGLPAEEIIERMRVSGTVYRLEASRLAMLRDEGVPDEVIDYMQRTYLDAVRRDQRLQDMRYWTPGGPGYWYGGPHYGWPAHRRWWP
jgi:hypothetical protein